MKSISKRLLSSSSLVAMMLTGYSVPTLAQDADDEGVMFEEIVVTSRRISESLTDVPATVTVMTESTIRDAGIERAEDFIGMTAGVTIVDAAEVGDTQVNIRGINGARDAENSFAFIVDGVLMTNPAAFNREFSDLSQIEILKGPQGAIYGRNAAAGAIIVTTKRPGEEMEGSIKASVAEDSTYYLQGMVSGPLSDKAFYRVSADYRSSDGFYTNEYLGADVVDDFENYNLNGRLVVDVSEALSIDAKMRYGKAEAAAITFNAAFALPAFTGFSPLWNENVNDHNFQFQSNIDPLNEQESFELSIKADYEMDWATLTVWGLYSDIDNYLYSDGTSGAFNFFNDQETCEQTVADLFGNVTFPGPTLLGNVPESLFAPASWPATDANGNPTMLGSIFGPYTPTACDGIQFQQRNQKDVSFEARLAGETDDMRWLVGAYYLEIDRQVAVSLQIDQGRGVDAQPYTGPSSISPTEQLVWDQFDSTVFALFGQVAYDVSDDFEASLALRYDREERKATSLVPTDARSQFVDFDGDFFFGGGAPLNPGLDPAFGGGNQGTKKRTFEEVEPKLSLTYDLAEEATAFASWGIGFKSGGFNNSGSAAIVDVFYNQPLGANLGVKDTFEKETSSAFEVGVKGRLADGMINYELAAYQTTVDDMQFFEFLVGSFGLLRVVTNIDEVDIKGFEANVNVRPTEWLTLYGAYNITDSEIKANSTRPDTVGNESPYTADYTINLGAQVMVPVVDDIQGMIRADWQRVGPTWFHAVQAQDRPTIFGAPGNYTLTEREAYSTLDMRAGIQADNWSLTAFAKNLTNEKYLEEIIPAPEFGGSFIHPGSMRRYGVEMSFRF